MKKLILILVGISIILGGVILVLYKREINTKEEVVDIFKEKEKEQKDKEEISNKKNKETKVIVDIKGMVVNPGVYEVDSNLRVNDVIELAGGLLEGADTSYINLAKIVTDEMTIIIYSNEEVLEKYKKENCICEECNIVNNACINTEDNNKLININTASLDGIGESKAKSIISYREEHGLFNKVEDIKNVSGIGESLFEKIKIYITV